LAGYVVASVVARWRGDRSHSVGAGTLVSEKEGTDNQHEVEGAEGGALHRVEAG
jgi:hypothetical protein